MSDLIRNPVYFTMWLKLNYINSNAERNLHADAVIVKNHMVGTQLTKNVSGTFGVGCMKVWLNLTLLERNAYVRHWSYKSLAEPNVLKMLFKYSDSV